jgi:hypothetical protein
MTSRSLRAALIAPITLAVVLALAPSASAGGEPPFVGCHVGLAPASATSKSVNFTLDCEDGGLPAGAQVIFRLGTQGATSVKSPKGLTCTASANLVFCTNASTKQLNGRFNGSFATSRGAACGTSNALQVTVSGGTNTTVQGPCLLTMSIKPNGDLRPNSRTCFTIRMTSSGGFPAKNVKLTMPNASATTNSQGAASPCARIPTPPSTNPETCLQDFNACFFTITAKGTGYPTLTTTLPIGTVNF